MSIRGRLMAFVALARGQAEAALQNADDALAIVPSHDVDANGGYVSLLVLASHAELAPAVA